MAKKTSEKIAFLLLQLWYTPLQLGHGGAETQETRKGNYQFPQKIYEMKVVLEGAISEVVKEKFPIWNAFLHVSKFINTKESIENYSSRKKSLQGVRVSRFSLVA